VLADAEMGRAASTVVAAGTAHDLARWSERTGKVIGPRDVEPMIWAIAELGRAVGAVEYIRSVEHLHAFSREVARWWIDDGFDLLLTPTLLEPPPRLGTFDATPEEPLAPFARAGAFVTFTLPFNVTGQPAISLPLHWNPEGLPIGVQLVAASGREDVLIRVAAQLEQARPWSERRPPVHA
jgi:amidase